MHMSRPLQYLLLLLLLTACASQPVANLEPLQYASLLHMEQTDSFTLVQVSNPWHKGRTMATYVLVPDSQQLPQQMPQGTLIRTPLKRTVVTSSVHAALLLDLGAEARMVGITDVSYIVSQRLQHYLATHTEVNNMGTAMTPDVERYKAVQADAVLVSSFDQNDHGALQHAGIPLIECADYMETSPLGRAEWMRFYGRLYGKAHTADSLFAEVAQRYIQLKQQALQSGGEHPTVMCDLRMGSTWYQPGGASTMGQFITDAGGQYIWADRKESGSIPLDLESVYARAHKADIWLVKYGQLNDLSYEQMKRDCAQYAQFAPWQHHHVYGCNTLRQPFYEEVPFHPDYLLRNLINVFHTAKVSCDTPYYTPLK